LENYDFVEKTTGKDPALIKYIGIRLFGIAGSRNQQKLPKRSKINTPNKLLCENFGIFSFSQNRNQEPLVSLAKVFKDFNEII